MGNQAGKTSADQAQYGGIFVKLDQETFTPGDTLSGNIYVDLRASYPGDMICLEVKGSEFTKWIDREARQRPNPNGPEGAMETYYVDIPREATRNIIKNDLTVYDWAKNQIIPPGQYTFPFAFQIPGNLPGSFYFQRGNAVAEIKYSVEGYLKPERDNVPKLKHKVYLTMREKMQQTIQQKELNLTKKISTWCCIDQGTISMRTAFEKDAYAPGEEARMLTEIDNAKCSLNIENVIFTLSQTINLSDGNGHGRYFSFPIRTVNLGSIAPGTSAIGDQRKSASIVLPPGQEGRAKDFTGAPVQDPDPTQIMTPSAHGVLVKSDFSLSLTCSVEGCICCDGVPSVSIPIQVYSALQRKQPDPIPPPNWNPTPMPQANLTITIVQLANGGHEIHIDTGAPSGQPGMMGGQMPPQQPGFAQPNQQVQQPMMEPAKPMMQPMGNPQMNNSQQQPLMNNSFNNTAQMNNSFGNPNQMQQQPQPQYQQQPQPQYQQQPQAINPQPVQIGQNNQYNPQPMNNGMVQQQPMNNQYQQPQQPMNTQYQQQPQAINPQPVQVAQNNQWQTQNPNQYNQQPMNNGMVQQQPQYQQQPTNNGQWQTQNPNQYNQPIPNQY